jgi:chemotaxis protein MotB
MSAVEGGIDHLYGIGARRRAQGATEDPDQEGWLISYADFITLLLIFFALMLSISAVSKAKFELLTHQFNQASSASLVELQKQLNAEIQRQHLESQVSTQISDEGLQISFNESVLFASGEAAVNEGGQGVLKAFARVLTGVDKNFHLAIEGHTDSRPIHTERFPSNWSLSAVRSVNVLHLMAAQGLDERKMMVRAYADTRPAAAPGSLSQNRRATLLVF